MNAFAADPGFAVWPEALSERDVSLLLSALDESPNRSRAGVCHLMSNLRIYSRDSSRDELARVAANAGKKNPHPCPSPFQGEGRARPVHVAVGVAVHVAVNVAVPVRSAVLSC
jgi:hypothetical protein